MKKNRKKTLLKLVICIVIIFFVCIVFYINKDKINSDIIIYYDIGTGKEILPEEITTIKRNFILTWNETKYMAEVRGPNGINTYNSGVEIGEDGLYEISVNGTTRTIELKKNIVTEAFEIIENKTSKVTLKLDPNRVSSIIIIKEDGTEEEKKIDFEHSEVVIEVPGHYNFIIVDTEDVGEFEVL